MPDALEAWKRKQATAAALRPPVRVTDGPRPPGQAMIAPQQQAPQPVASGYSAMNGSPGPATPAAAPPPPVAPVNPPPASAGFNAFSRNPMMQAAVRNTLIAPNTPVLPPEAMAQTQGAQATEGPTPATSTASGAPPASPPKWWNQTLDGPAPSTQPTQGRTLPAIFPPNWMPPPSVQSEADWAAQNPDQLAVDRWHHKPGSGFRGFLRDAASIGTAGVLGAAGGLNGNPGAGATWAAQQAALADDTQNVNHQRYLQRVVEPAQQAVALTGKQLDNATASQSLSEAPQRAGDAHALSGAQTANLTSETYARDHPDAPGLEFHETQAGPLLINRQNGEARHVSVDGKAVGPDIKLDYHEVVGPDGHPHVFGFNQSGQRVADLGRTYQKPEAGPGGEWHIEERPDGKGGVEGVLMSGRTGAIKPVPGGVQAPGTAAKQNASAIKTYGPVMDSAERFNVMSQNYEDAIHNHDQQAMLSLLSNHLGMTAGLQKGGRITKDMYTEAQKSRPWLSGVKAAFDGDGYLSGVTLTPEQMRQMVQLGQDRFQQDTSKARSEAKYAGVQGDGPERTMGPATARYYYSKAKGDPAKATAMATADGWSVE